MNHGSHVMARFTTAAQIFNQKNATRAKTMHPIPNACRLRLSIPASFTSEVKASSICVFFEMSGMYLKSNIVSWPRPLLLSTMTCQNNLRSACPPCSASIQHVDKGLAYHDVSSVEVWHRSVCVADTHEKETLPDYQSPVIKTWSANTESIA